TPGQPPQMQSPQGQPGQQGSGEQQMYDTVVGQSEEYIFGQGLESVKQRLQAGAENGVEDDVGAIVGNILAMNYQSAVEAGRTIPPKVMAGAAKELTEVVTDIAVEMKLITPQEANAGADEALYVAMATFGKASARVMPQQERQQYQQLIQTLQEAEAKAKGIHK
ncbi:MAG: hypothetical protein LPH21_18735, partial [Shewanella sp.]|nr:hypothetical protein [Shewanella sp.]